MKTKGRFPRAAGAMVLSAVAGLSGCQDRRADAPASTPATETSPAAPENTPPASMHAGNAATTDETQALKALFPTLQGMYRDEKTGERVLYVLEQDRVDAGDARLASAEKLLGTPVRFKVLPAPIEEQR